MKFLSTLLVIIVSAQALPTYVDLDNPVHPNALRTDEQVIGFASFGDGTYGGQGGPVWTVHDPWGLRDAVTGDLPRIIYVRGVLDMLHLFETSPGVMMDIGKHKTIIGADSTARIIGGGLNIVNTSQVIIRDLKFENALSIAPGESHDGNGFIANSVGGEYTYIDNIRIDQSKYVWVDHNEFSDDPWIAANIPSAESRHDGLLDIVNGSNYITVSNNLFRNHDKTMLIGHVDTHGHLDSGRFKISLIQNWFMGTRQRHPRVRFGTVHVVNNLFTNISSYGIGVGVAASIIAEKNVFRSSLAWRYPTSAVPVPAGNILDDDNWLLDGSRFHPNISNNVAWKPSDYYEFKALSVDLVEAHVRSNAGNTFG